MKRTANVSADAKRTIPASLRKNRSAAVKAVPVPRDRGLLQLAHQHILDKISNGRLPVHAALSELSLAAELGLSRTPVREAIGQLVTEGILQKTSRGAVVAEHARQDIIELYQLREALEVYVIGEVASRGLSARELETLKQQVEQVRLCAVELKQSGKPVLEGDLLKKFVTCDLRFHMLILQAGGNQRIVRVLDSTRLLLRIFTLRREHHTVKLLEQVYDFHRRILAAVARGDAGQARKLLGEHIQLSRDERLAEYEEPRLTGTGW
ncbi:MAG: transcriptional regulator [Verrucomicrobiaceae bacterium]|nr:transcriptional regulator [Verrucomicrobiaceae bacterium]